VSHRVTERSWCGLERISATEGGFNHVGLQPDGRVFWHSEKDCHVLPVSFRRCRRPPRGWRCSRTASHGGPCAARPAWWNVPARAMRRLPS